MVSELEEQTFKRILDTPCNKCKCFYCDCEEELEIKKDFSNLNEKKHTKEQWYNMINSIKKRIVKIPEWVYYHFLESVPPIYLECGFFNSEPINHNKEGNPVYFYFFECEGSFYGTISSMDSYKYSLKIAKEQISKDEEGEK